MPVLNADAMGSMQPTRAEKSARIPQDASLPPPTFDDADTEKMITETDLEELTEIDLEELINELFPEIADVFCFLSDYESETKKDA